MCRITTLAPFWAKPPETFEVNIPKCEEYDEVEESEESLDLGFYTNEMGCRNISCFGPFEEFKTCGNRCAESCDQFVHDCGDGTVDQCLPGCYCKDGYLRSTNTTTCVHITDCILSLFQTNSSSVK